ncbi:MAG: hypothetical protein ACRCYD_01770 [Plesiomonas sp.]
MKMNDVFNNKFSESMLSVNPECVKEEWDDGVTPHDHIVHAVKSHDDMKRSIEISGEALIEAVSDIDKLKKELHASDMVVSNLTTQNEMLEQKLKHVEKLLSDASIQGDSSKQIALSFMRVTRDMVTMLNMAGTEKEKDSINPFSHWLWLADELLETYKFIGTGGDPI